MTKRVSIARRELYRTDEAKRRQITDRRKNGRALKAAVTAVEAR